MTKSKTNLIPVGYLTKEAVDVSKGDAVEEMGIIRKITYVGQHEFTMYNDTTYVTSAIEFQALSVLTGRKLYFVVPMDAPLKVMQYADPDNYEFEYLPLESSDILFSSEHDFDSRLKNLVGMFNDE